MKILRNEFVLPITQKQCHASHVLVLDDERVFCVFFYGTKEGNDDVRIYGSMRSRGGEWSEPTPITEDDGLPHFNPVLFKRQNGEVVLFYKVGRTFAEWKTYFKTSLDGCITWSEPKELVEGDESGGRGPVRNKMLRLKNGIVIAPASTEQGEWKCFFDISYDDGKTFVRGRDLCVPKGTLDKYESLKNKGIIQPTLWQSNDGVHALMRSSEGVIYRTDSLDGLNWCDPYPTTFPNNNSGIDLVKLLDGRIVLCCNQVSDDWGARSPISLYISSDNGKTFELLTHLTTGKGEFSYPALIYENGKLHISYTFRRQTVQYFCLEI